MLEFFNMGGYGFYVWGSYGFVVVVLIGMHIAPSWRRRKLLEEINSAGDDRRR